MMRMMMMMMKAAAVEAAIMPTWLKCPPFQAFVVASNSVV